MISELGASVEHSGLVLEWLRSTWDDPHNVFAETLEPVGDRPGALIAIVDGAPRGVLTFRRYQAGSQATAELWINAVYVVPSHRRNGIGRELIRAAVTHSIPDYAERLLAFTEFPTLYESIGWKRIADDAEHASCTVQYEADAARMGEFLQRADGGLPP